LEAESHTPAIRRGALTALGAVVAVVVVYYVVPRVVDLGPTLRRLSTGNVWWLALGVLFEAGSYSGQALLLRGVFSTEQHPIGWRTCGAITLAGAAATKVVAAAGAGGIAVTTWALRAEGVAGGEVASGMVCYEVITYSVYMAALAIAGYGLWFGLFSGTAPVGLTLVPATFATAVIVLAISMLFVYGPVERALQRRADRTSGRRATWWRRAAAVPRALRSGFPQVRAMVRRRDRSLLGALANWGFDIGVLWAAFHAFGHSPPGAVLVTAYYVGTLGNALPLPGGVGGVEGGMIGSFVGFGVSGHLAVTAVLAYRTISYWLPAVPGAIAYLRLRRRFDQDP
jgi:uncharacterized protein (TIRG00374 family)